MQYLVALLVMASVSLLVVGVAALAPGRAAAIRRRLTPERPESEASRRDEREERQERRRQVEELIRRVGRKVSSSEESSGGGIRADLIRAGIYDPNAVALYYGSRMIATFAIGVAAGMTTSFTGVGGGASVLAVGAMAMFGWLIPKYWLKRRIRQRAKEIQKALADTLDLLVVCVEAGLGLNQAFVRVSQEIGGVSPAMSEELNLVNLEIRAGTPRDEALRHLGERTNVPDLKSLTGMLIQTDRFGTSIARALRVHADSLRTKRRQRAEEQAAKTTIKLVFPLVLFVFPAMFVVILSPAVMHIMGILQDVGN